MVFDYSDSETLENIDQWLKFVEDYQVPKLILGNKCDLSKLTL
jgi:GTPase SAR1 family protein